LKTKAHELIQAKFDEEAEQKSRKIAEKCQEAIEKTKAQIQEKCSAALKTVDKKPAKGSLLADSWRKVVDRLTGCC
jgi:enoyl-CoA hydratase/carnithine racemase